MKAIKIVEPGKVEITEYPDIQPTEEEVLLKIIYIGLCGSDLSSYLGKNPMVHYPVIPGHEIAGEIVQLGSKVPQNLRIGQRVTVNPYTSCGTCASCRKGRVNACQNNQTFGVQRDGALREYLAVPWQKVILADKLGDQELALVEPLSVGFHAVSRGRVRKNESVVVFGCGMIGLGAIIAAVERGAAVIAVDIDNSKLDLALALGVREVIHPRNENLEERLAQITHNLGPDVIIEAVGSPATYLDAINHSAFCGRVVCIGYAKEDIAFATKLFVQRELDILGSRNALDSDFQSVIKYLQKKTCPTEQLISGIFSPDQTGQALEMWHKNRGVVLKQLIRF